MKYKLPNGPMPHDVMVASIVPVSLTYYNETVAKYPEWFPEVVEWRRKLDLVPKEVHDAYDKEYSELFQEHFKAGPYPGKGIMWYINHPVEREEHMKWKEEHKEEFDYIALFNKHYSPYGLVKTY